LTLGKSAGPDGLPSGREAPGGEHGYLQRARLFPEAAPVQ
jgi:hypothetical protein